MSKQDTGCSIVAQALNKAGVPSDTGKPWTEEDVEKIWNGPAGEMARILMKEKSYGKR